MDPQQAVNGYPKVLSPVLDEAGRLARLAELAHLSGFAPVQPKPQLWPPSTTRFGGDLDYIAAKEVVMQIRTADPYYKDPSQGVKGFFKSKKSKTRDSDPQQTSFSFKELAAALATVVETTGSAAIAEALIELGADVNISKRSSGSVIKKMRTDNNDEPSRYLQIATEKRNCDMVRLLAMHGSDQQHLDAALQIALERGYADVLQILVEHGSNPNTCVSGFQMAVRSNNCLLVEILFRAPKPLDRQELLNVLVECVQTGTLEMPSLLLAYGATIDQENYMTVIMATKQRHYKLLLQMFISYPLYSSEQVVPEHILNQCVEDIATCAATDTRHQLFEVLLCAGAAKGSAAAQRLVEEVRYTCYEIVYLLLQYGADVNLQEAQALKIAVATGNYDLTQLILQRQPDVKFISEAFSLVPSGAHEGQTCQILSLLLSRGASGLPVDEALSVYSGRGFQDAVVLLLANHASVQYKEGLALEKAVLAEQLPIIEILLEHSPSWQSQNRIFPMIRRLAKEKYLPMTKLFINVGLKGPVVDEALTLAIEGGRDLDVELIRTLVDGEAKIEGKSIQAIAQLADIEILKILLKGKPSSQAINSSLRSAMMCHNPRKRLEMIDLLTTAGATGDPLAETLLYAIREGSQSRALVQLLLAAGANVNFNGGEALQEALKQDSAEFVQLVIELGHASTESLSSALVMAVTLDSSNAQRISKMEHILHAGVSRGSLDESLVRAVEHQRSDRAGVVQLLLRLNADVNHDEGRALQIATKTASKDILILLLQRQPAVSTLSASFPLALIIPNPDDRYEVVQMILRQGMRGPLLDIALAAEAKTHTPSLPLCSLLQDFGASCNHGGGEALISAIIAVNIELVKLLLRKGPPTRVRSKTLAAALPFTRQIENPNSRFHALRLIVKAGATGDLLNDTLVYEAKNSTMPHAIVSLLITSGASINHQNGQALDSAIRSGDAELVSMFTSRKPSVETLFSIFASTQLLEDELKRHSVSRLVLDAGAAGSVVDDALIAELKQPGRKMETVLLLLERGASVSHMNGECIHFAAAHGLADYLDIFMKHQPLPETLQSAFPMAFALQDRTLRFSCLKILLRVGASGHEVDKALVYGANEETLDQELIKLLLASRASLLYNNGEAIRSASVAARPDVLSFLVTGFPQEKSKDFLAMLSSVFDECITNEVEWTNSSRLLIIQTLLQEGARSPSSSTALIDAVGYATDIDMADQERELARSYVFLLLAYGADINQDGGRCLQIAAERGNVELITAFLSACPSKHAISTAFPYLLKFVADEEVLLQLANLFPLHEPERLNLNFRHPKFNPLLFDVIERFPQGNQLLSTLLEAGCEADQKISLVIDPHTGEERATVLLWGLCRPQLCIGTSVFARLLRAQANPNFATSRTQVTPLLMAAHTQRVKVMIELIKHGADPTAIDVTGRTAQSAAGVVGNVDAISLLLGAGAELNDGSLHDAAGNGKLLAVEVLLQNGHEVDFPTTRHGGRSALGEMCLNASPARGKLADFRAIMKLLIAAGAHLDLKTDDRSILLLALDNEDPFDVTEALLDSGAWRSINKELNLFIFNNMCYSPTMYIAKSGVCRSDQQYHEQLLKLLRTKRCVDIFYALDGPQPLGAIGQPGHIVKAELIRKENEQRLANLVHEERLKMQLEQEASQTRLRARQIEQQSEIQLQEELERREDAKLDSLHRKRITHENELAVQAQTIADAHHNSLLQHEQYLGQERLRIQGQQAQQEYRAEQSRAQLRLKTENEAAVQQQSVLDHKRRLMSAERADAEAYDKRAHERALTALREQRNNIKAHSTAMQRQGEVARLGSVRDQQRLTWPDEEPD